MFLFIGSQPEIMTITAQPQVMDVSYQQPEIVTVPETIVTITAQNSISTNDTSLSSDRSDKYRFRTMGSYAKVSCKMFAYL